MGPQSSVLMDPLPGLMVKVRSGAADAAFMTGYHNITRLTNSDAKTNARESGLSSDWSRVVT